MIIHQLEGHIQSTYLVEYPDKLLMFDSGTRSDVDRFLDFIQNTLKREISDLKVVVISHMHPDHSGGAKRLKKLTGCLLVGGKNINSWYQGPAGFLEHKVDIALTYWVASKKQKKLKNLFFKRDIKFDVELSEGDCIPHFNDWSVLFTPGHTTVDISLLNNNTRDLYVADNIIKLKKGYCAPYPMYNPLQYIESLNKYDKLEISRYLLAHGGIIDVNKIELESIINLVRRTPRTHIGFVKYKLSRLTRS